MPNTLKMRCMLLCAAFTACLTACKPGINQTYTDDADTADETLPSCELEFKNTGGSDEAKTLFNVVRNLSCDKETFKGYLLSGQSVGDLSSLAGNDSLRNYQGLIEDLNTSTDKRIAIASVEMGEKTSDANEATAALNQLSIHAESSGIVSVTWIPLNPFEGANNSAPTAPSDDVDLNKLSDDKNEDLAVYKDYEAQMEAVSKYLSELEKNNIAVLFAPLVKMNKAQYWYGNGNASQTEFRNLWIRTQNYFNRKNSSLVWVYAPEDSATMDEKTALWGYNQQLNIDVIAPWVQDADLKFPHYKEYLEKKIPLGLTRLSHTSTDGQFDNTAYDTRLRSRYPALAYWISDHDSYSLARNRNAADLLKRSNIVTANTLASKGWLE